jgi:release factor glutamine methyltransferase
MTLKDWLQRGEAQLRFGPHPERARSDAETLLRHVVKHGRAALMARLKENLDEQEAERYSALLERRVTGEPIQYIFGEQEFYGLPLHVTRDVLIPRPETEHLVEKVVGLLPLFHKPRIVDVGTGSGAIALALAHEWPSAVITAIDISLSALDLARQNAERIGLAERIRFLHGDLLVPVAAEQFDFVVSNPPYVPIADRTSLAVEVREYEPPLALFAGEDGLDVYRRLIPAAFASLVPGGFIVLEIGFGHAQAIHSLLGAGDFQRIEFTPDLQGIPRVASAQRA